jgi:ribosomal-protein-alanine N-acetyltransferase
MILEANKTHLEQIFQIEKESFKNPWSYNSFLKEISNNLSLNRVFVEERKVLGYLFGWNLSYDYHLNNIAVESFSRRKGVAKKMINNIIFIPEIKNIYLEVSCLNCEAINLYEKIGFKQNGLREKYYKNGSDAILYKMEIK